MQDFILAKRDQIAELCRKHHVVPGFLPTNTGIPSQSGSNAFLTNQGSSNYHGLLLTLTKKAEHGLASTSTTHGLTPSVTHR